MSFPDAIRLEMLNTVYSGQTFHLTMIDGDTFTGTFTVDSANDILAISGHTLVDRTRIQVTSTNTLPGGLAVGTTYYAQYYSPSGIRLYSDRALSTLIDITGVGAGTHTLIELPLAVNDALNVFANHEISGHANWTARYQWVPSGFAQGDPSTIATASTVVSPTAPNGDIVFQHLLLIRDGEAAIGNVSGRVWAFVEGTSSITILEGESRILSVGARF